MALIAVFLKFSLMKGIEMFLGYSGFGIGQGQAGGDLVSSTFVITRILKLLVTGRTCGSQPPPCTGRVAAWMCAGCGVSSALYYVCLRGKNPSQ